MKKASELLKTAWFKALMILIVSLAASLTGFTAAFGYGGGGSYYTAPVVSTATNAPLSVNATQEGSLSQSFSDGSKVEVGVPKGAVESETTFKTEQGSLTAENTPVNTIGAIMIGGQIFNINATDLNGQAIRNFSQPLNITITVNNLPADTSDLGVYYFNETSKSWNLIPGAVFNSTTGKVTFTVNHLTKFAVFKAENVPATLAVTPVSTDETAKPNESDKTVTDREGKVLGVEVYNFERNLYYTYRGDDVKVLQQFLIDKNIGSAAKALSKFGPTGYFGPYTRAALAEYQKSVGIYAAGNFGPITRAHLSNLYK